MNRSLIRIAAVPAAVSIEIRGFTQCPRRHGINSLQRMIPPQVLQIQGVRCGGFGLCVHYGLILSFISMAAFNVHAKTVYYTLDNVMLDDGTQMTGVFSWSFTNDFEKGSGQFIALDIPWTSHDESDLFANIDVTKTIEITLTNNVHDDGVDIKLVLEQPLTPTTSSLLVLEELVPGEGGESKYEIGGNGFHTGQFLSGSIAPINATLSISTPSSGGASLSWEPDFPGYVLF